MSDTRLLAEATTSLGDVRPTDFRGRYRVLLIRAGWGSSGYYSEAVLRADGPTAWPAGTANYLDHPTPSENLERPERSVKDWASFLVTDPVWDPAERGLVAEVQVFPQWLELLNPEFAAQIGLSIRATGTVEYGEAEGRQGPIVTSLGEGLSVDWVTQAGAGGRVLQLIESARTLTERTWREEDHPRGYGGRFGSGTGPSGTSPGREKGSSTRPARSSGTAKGTGSSRAAGGKAAAPAKAPDKAAAKPPATAPAKDKEWLNSHYSGWRDGLTPAQDKALRFYQSPGFALMNGQLRGLAKDDIKADVSFNDADLARARTASRNLKAAIKNAPPLDEPMTVYRGFSADQFGDLKADMTVTDKAFVSTSITPDVGAVGKAARQATAEIVLPKGAKAAAGSARELVLPPGSKFRVISVATRRGVPHVRMELVV